MNRNDCQFLFRNQNCNLPIRFGTPRSQMNLKRSSSNCGRKLRVNSINSEIVGRKFTKLVHDVDNLFLVNILKGLYDHRIRCRTPAQKVKVVPGDVCDHSPKLTGNFFQQFLANIY